jgi:hypothetical protein
MTGEELRRRLRALPVDAPQRWLAERCGVHETTIYRQCERAEVLPVYAFIFELLDAVPSDRLAQILS